ncbi:unnamed protein product [Pleuronectes platessa]|uniref:Uncharacterized protein n=1 Tax=Pleuronectes platessa TaxID=8262 RepID=A0A9N7VH44_PLEPL|nr:unnamed protein product [Pleuronectes platessa]
MTELGGGNSVKSSEPISVEINTLRVCYWSRAPMVVARGSTPTWGRGGSFALSLVEARHPRPAHRESRCVIGRAGPCKPRPSECFVPLLETFASVCCYKYTHTHRPKYTQFGERARERGRKSDGKENEGKNKVTWELFNSHFQRM